MPFMRRDPVRSALMWCGISYCVVGLTLLALDAAACWVSGRYESPSIWSLVALRWLTLPGISLAGGAAMVAGAAIPRRPAAFLLALLMLIVYAWLWDLADFLTTSPPTLGD